jgi:uncharacterized membrane protein (DUF2068 family)
MREEAMHGHVETTRVDPATHSHSGGLLAIGVFKLAKSIFFFCLGIGAFHLLHRDLAEEATRLANALHFEPEWRITALLTEKVTLIDQRQLREIGFATFAYSAIALVEGIGLMLEKVWAEYLTLSLTVMFLPWELWELARRPSWVRLGLLLINLAVLGYLLWLLERKKKAA